MTRTTCPHSSGWSLSALLLVLGFVCGMMLLSVSTARAQTFNDPGFVTELLTTLPPYKPVGLAFAPDGRIFIWQENGVVRIFKNGALLPTPFVNLQPRVNTFNDRGLLGLALDPSFATNGYVYLLYTYEEGSDPNSMTPKTARLTRVKADPANPDVALAGSETVILGSIGTPPCSNYPAGADCIPSDSDTHTVGTLRFAPDGKLFVSIGDGAGYIDADPQALRAQNLNSYAGKILRINRDGSAPGDNPFDDGTSSIRSKVYSYGLRNPYRFTLHPTTGEVYLGDVGWFSFEEVNRGRGANFGWPCYEGHLPHPLYQMAFEQCREMSPGAVTPPLYTYSHMEGNSVIGGSFYTGTQYPAQYRGDYFFADYGYGFIRRIKFDASGQLQSVQEFVHDLVAPVSLEMGPDGLLYYISLSTGEIRRIRFEGPVAKAVATPRWGYSPLNVSFSSAGSLDPGGGQLSYHWEFGDGASSNLPNPSHSYTSATVGTFEAVLTVTDSQMRSATDRVTLTVGSTPPTATITAPANGTAISPGDVVNFQGLATDADETLPPSALTWTVLLHHNNHVHPSTTASGAGGSFMVEAHGEGVYSYEIILTATDSSGLSNSKSVTLPVSVSHLPAPWINQDIGSTGGSASFANGTFTVRGAGADIWDSADAFHYVYQPMDKSGQITARVTGIGLTDEWAKAGIMIRETLAPDARHASLFLTASNGVAFQRRMTTGGISEHTAGDNTAAPVWLRLLRKGTRVTAYSSPDGVTWTQVGASIILSNLNSSVFVGLAVTSHNNGAVCAATFTNVSVKLGTRPQLLALSIGKNQK